MPGLVLTPGPTLLLILFLSVQSYLTPNYKPTSNAWSSTALSSNKLTCCAAPLPSGSLNQQFSIWVHRALFQNTFRDFSFQIKLETLI